jgi:hypothetical protein
MTRGYANIFVFPCGKCQFPIAIAKPTAIKQELTDFRGQTIQSMCPMCGHREVFLSDNAVGFHSVEWNFEIRLQPRNDYT